MKKHTIKELLSKVTLCNERIDESLEDKEILLEILTCYEEIQSLVKNGHNGENIIEKVVSGCIDLYTGLINEEVTNNLKGLDTAYTFNELLKDYINDGHKGNGFEPRVDEAMKDLHGLFANDNQS